jgi:hypothetical protein
MTIVAPDPSLGVDPLPEGATLVGVTDDATVALLCLDPGLLNDRTGFGGSGRG